MAAHLAMHERAFLKVKYFFRWYVRCFSLCRRERSMKHGSFLNRPSTRDLSSVNISKSRSAERANGADAAALMQLHIVTGTGNMRGLAFP